LKEGLQLRNTILNGVIEAFRPDAIFTDCMPLGLRDELEDLLANYPGKKYLILRGVLGDPQRVNTLTFGKKQGPFIERHYDRVLVASDRRVCDLTREYQLTPIIANKVQYCGYICKPISAEAIAAVRSERGVAPDDTYVVCSAGGGMTGENLVGRCMTLAAKHRDVLFDIVIGPRSNLNWPKLSTASYIEGNIRYIKESAALPLLHGSADVVITPGGYNSLVEAMQGHARIIAVSTQERATDELYAHAARLQPYHAVTLVAASASLEDAFSHNLALVRDGVERTTSDHQALDFAGVEKIRHIVLEDLSGGDC
jgi:predicted glycosyltransferase